MKKLGWVGLALVVPGGVAATDAAQAADTSSRSKAPINCKAPDAPYKNYDCLDAYLGDGFFERMVNYYKLEWGHEGPPADPKAPSARRPGWPDAPATTPPFPFTEWPYGGSTSIGVTRPSSADSPLMVAMANSQLGKTLNDNNMQIAEGMLLRLGRFISVPDIEAQLAPNNYMYTHSMTYTFDNYTNTGLQTTTALNKNWFVQLGVTVGTEAMPWHWGQTIPNPFPNPVYPGNTMLKDPGAKPSVTAGIRWQSDSGWDNIYVVADAINDGTWGYNNLQWKGVTWYHRINSQWHFSWEAYSLSQNNVLNLNNNTHTFSGSSSITDVQAILGNGGFPFGPTAGINYNAPNGAQCSNPNVLTCKAEVFATVMYLNYQFSPLDNISFRPEFYNDMQGQRTGTKTRYVDFGLGWQHWFSPQVEIRPEVTYYRSLDAPAFNGNFNALPAAIVPTKKDALIAAADLIWHF
jgi:Putative beta-barrel porin-2, OmpL-like. bbp2